MLEKNWILFFVILVVAIISTIFLTDVATTGGMLTGEVIHKIQPPNPVVLDVDCNEYNTGVLNLDSRIVLTAKVINYGSGSNILVTGKIDQDKTQFDAMKSQTIYINKGEVKEVKFDYDISSFRSWKCTANARAVS